MTVPHRVVVWSTGGVGSNAIKALTRRPDLDLVGVWVHNAEKVGRDVGELVGLDPLGVLATDDADALVALAPDCVIYAASGPERGAGAAPDYERLLAAGINVVTTTSTELVFPPSADEALRVRLQDAATSGGASLYASGIFPGFASDELAVLLTTMSRNIHTLRLIEISLNDHYPVADVMMDGLGLRPRPRLRAVHRRPRDHPHDMAGPDRADRQRPGRRARRDPWPARTPAHRAGPRGGVRNCPGRHGRCRPNDRRRHGRRSDDVVDHVIRMARDVAGDWPTSDNDATYIVNIEGDPDIDCRLTLGPPEGHDAGEAAMMATAMRIVNAVPFVVGAPAGLLSSLDLPVTVPACAFS